MKQKFDEMIDNKINGNISDFKAALKKLNKANLLRFAVHCATYDLMDIFEIEKYFNS